MAASANSGGLGISRSGGNDDGAKIHVTLPGKTIQLWVSCVSRSGRSERNMEAVETGGYRRRPDGRVHDGSGGECKRAGVYSSGLYLLQCRGWRGQLISASAAGFRYIQGVRLF